MEIDINIKMIFKIEKEGRTSFSLRLTSSLLAFIDLSCSIASLLALLKLSLYSSILLLICFTNCSLYSVEALFNYYDHLIHLINNYNYKIRKVDLGRGTLILVASPGSGFNPDCANIAFDTVFINYSLVIS